MVATFMASLGLLSGVVSMISSAFSRTVECISHFRIFFILRKSRVALIAVVVVVSFDRINRVSSRVSRLVAVFICPLAAFVRMFKH